ncbi:GNAT family N-acetyltransferase [Nonomuraea sp. NPDC023979]|uniref:GNAT family N-acetyltransferase n=1 Tax=Nonomuraea sp. NPDC023979 TaxID=3154796 RepID=UPI003404C096
MGEESADGQGGVLPRTGESVLVLGSGGGVLGSGGGFDVLPAAQRVGPYGTAYVMADGLPYGLDGGADGMERARREAARAGLGNVRFLRGGVEGIPLPGQSVDVVVCGGLPDGGEKAVAEAFRVLRPGGRFGMTATTAAMTADAVTDAVTLLAAAGFVSIRIAPATDHGQDVSSPIIQAVKPPVGPGLEIRPMRDSDAPQVLAIYQMGLDTGEASFETVAPSWEGFNAGRLRHLRYVAVDVDSGEAVGWVAASPVSSRQVYSGVVEHSVYVHPGCQAHGIGRALLSAFVAATEDAGVWTIQSAIFPENAASLSLHQALGFRVVGTRERLGCHRGVWRDVLMLERRSSADPPVQHG